MTLLRKPSWLKLSRVVGALLIAAFFYAFQKRVLKAHFGPDEMMNIYGYWSPPLWKVLLSDLLFWSKFVRPMAGLYYLPLFHFFKLDPVPYSIVRIAMLGVNTIIFYKLARAVSGSWWVAVLASFPVAYQAHLGNLAFNGAFIYDAICGGFFFAALLYYIHARRGREHLNVRQAFIFLALCVCALDSKEMAVSLAVVAFSYELLLEEHPAGFRSPEERKRWAMQLWPTLAAGAITALFILGKTTGQGSLTQMDAYTPVLRWAPFAESSVRFMNTMFYADGFTMEHVIALWAVLLIAGIVGVIRRPGNRRWLFLWIWVMVTPLPIAFLPGRGGALLYIVAAGWAIVIAMMLRSVSWLLARHLFLGRLGRIAIMLVCLLVCGLEYEDETRRAHRYDVYGYLLTGAPTMQWIQELQQLGLQPKHGSSIIFLHDPAPTTYDMTFIAALVWRDHSLELWQQEQSHLTPERISRMDYIIDCSGDRFTLIKSPQTP
jgi:hypothetical protein